MKTIKSVRKVSKFVVVLAMGMLMFSACKKDEDNTPTPKPEPTKTDIITGSNWQMNSMLYNGNDMTSFLEECEKDNIMSFKTDGKYVEDEGPTKCDPSDKQTRNGTWKFINNETQLLMDKLDTLQIDLLTTDSLKVTIITYEDGKKEEIKSTFLKK